MNRTVMKTRSLSTLGLTAFNLSVVSCVDSHVNGRVKQNNDNRNGETHWEMEHMSSFTLNA